MRNDLIDLLRGIAFILMFIHHIFYFNPESLYTVPDIVDICGIISRTIFIILVGVSLGMFKKNKKSKKPYKTFISALLVSITSSIFLPKSSVIFFGTLHFISLVTIIFQNIEIGVKESIIGLIGSILLGNYMITTQPSDNYLNLILGSYTKTKFPLDIFPLTKWLPYVFFGLIIGKYMKYENMQSTINNVEPITYLGKNALFFYMLHVIPCIIWSSK